MSKNQFDEEGRLIVNPPEGGFPDQEYATLNEAAEAWGVKRSNIKYYVTRYGVPAKPIKVPVVTDREVLHVHMPSLKICKDNRIHGNTGSGVDWELVRKQGKK